MRAKQRRQRFPSELALREHDVIASPVGIAPEREASTDSCNVLCAQIGACGDRVRGEEISHIKYPAGMADGAAYFSARCPKHERRKMALEVASTNRVLNSRDGERVWRLGPEQRHPYKHAMTVGAIAASREPQLPRKLLLY